jgi:hypothetical protein
MVIVQVEAFWIVFAVESISNNGTTGLSFMNLTIILSCDAKA